MTKAPKISDVLRSAILAGPGLRRISAATGVAPSVLSRFVRGEQGIGLATADVLAGHFGLELVNKQAGRKAERK
jgi:plasmid maintenance system antidote protein VapI